jgi:hypothetical protein
VAQQTPALSVLVQALTATNLTGGPLADPQAVLTVFAPTNAAFSKLAGALGITPTQLLTTRTVRPRSTVCLYVLLSRVLNRVLVACVIRRWLPTC